MTNTTNFKPFDRVIVRDNNNDHWRINFFDHYEDDEEYHYGCLDLCWRQCLPYNEETAKLIGTTDDYVG